MQLYGGLPVVVENASNLLTKALEWPRLMAYLEQSTRYILFDKKINGRYLFKTPPGLPAHFVPEFEAMIERIFQVYSESVQAFIEHLRRRKPFESNKNVEIGR